MEHAILPDLPVSSEEILHRGAAFASAAAFDYEAAVPTCDMEGKSIVSEIKEPYAYRE